jgi:hypothetical protein
MGLAACPCRRGFRPLAHPRHPHPRRLSILTVGNLNNLPQSVFIGSVAAIPTAGGVFIPGDDFIF